MKMIFLAVLLAASPLETKNQKTVEDSIKLCHDSRCSICGKFHYAKFGETHAVEYDKSYCEEEFARKAEEKRASDEDQAIRAKYAPKDGGQ